MSKFNIFRAGLIFLGVVTSNIASAECGYIDISVENKTGHSCELVSYDWIHGSFYPDPMFSKIIPNDDTIHMIVQDYGFYGPDVSLKYQCGAGNVSLKVQKNYCFLADGNITASSSGTINAPYDNRYGNIFWTLLGSS